MLPLTGEPPLDAWKERNMNVKGMFGCSMAGLLSCASERVFALWSESYHLTKEASRFIISSAPGTRCQPT
jgi:hypothetical protein